MMMYVRGNTSILSGALRFVTDPERTPDVHSFPVKLFGRDLMIYGREIRISQMSGIATKMAGRLLSVRTINQKTKCGGNARYVVRPGERAYFLDHMVWIVGVVVSDIGVNLTNGIFS